MDRIARLYVTDACFTSQHPTLKTYIAQTAKEKHLETVVIRVEKSVYPNLSQQKYYSGFVSEKEIGGLTEMTFLTTSLEGFARWLMMFGDSAEIMQPDSLKERVLFIAYAIAQKIENQVSC